MRLTIVNMAGMRLEEIELGDESILCVLMGVAPTACPRATESCRIASVASFSSRSTSFSSSRILPVPPRRRASEVSQCGAPAAPFRATSRAPRSVVCSALGNRGRLRDSDAPARPAPVAPARVLPANEQQALERGLTGLHWAEDKPRPFDAGRYEW